MKRTLFTPACCMILLFARSQNFCDRLSDNIKQFKTALDMFTKNKTPSAADWAAFTTATYKAKDFITKTATGYYPNMQVLFVYNEYINQLKNAQLYNKAYTASTEAFDYIKNMPADKNSFPLTCASNDGTYRVYKDDAFRQYDAYLYATIQAADALKYYSSAAWYFMWGLKKGLYNQQDINTNYSAGTVLKEKVAQGVNDDTAFYAAFECIRTFYNIKDVWFTFNSRGKDESYRLALQVFTNPAYITKPVEEFLPNYNEVYDATLQKPAMYLLNFITLKKDTSISWDDKFLLLKRALQSYNAAGEKGFPYLGTLSFNGAIDNNMDCVNLTRTLIVSGDKELMELLAKMYASFKSEYSIHYHYAAHLLYHALGDDSKAKKMYNSLRKEDKAYFTKNNCPPVYNQGK